MKERPWADHFHHLSDAAQRALAAYRVVGEWVVDNVVAHDVLPRQVPEPLGTHLKDLLAHLTKTRELADALFDRFASAPRQNYSQGKRCRGRSTISVVQWAWILVGPKSLALLS
jgi:hypothetical protein